MAVLNDAAHVKVVGLPRALLYYRYSTLWETFFRSLGLQVVVSDPTDRAILQAGEEVSSDESCLASKVFMGAVANLIGRCDAVFIPSYASASPRVGFCTKYQSAPDMAANTFRDKNLPVISLLVEHLDNEREVEDAYVDLGKRLGFSTKEAKRAYKAARKAQKATDELWAKNQETALKDIKRLRHNTGDAPITILVVAHPYIGHDPFMADPVLDALKEAGAIVLFADETDKARAFKKSFEFTTTMPWVINRELIGSILSLQDKIDGIVLISAFPCGPDSMTDDAIMRCIEGTPILNLLIDAQNGTAGIQTRVESFMDILQFHKKGGYLHE
ncbi:acyl-CoA dehydratase activase-related protein [Parvibacter caecicola]|uniref:Putative nucleotide-binding protein (Sugar kinase/HSP70/actin superfamily) n=1 Tax=Parvibacter caecicola TaxID=747645 RepID=A0A7W5GPG7_9ACTN|nr:acyl-CoA dehydratase activase-related protein [Parvibacter caecicola]MBB3171152.1 putative nucleotide-binding protein (sugar kinase/HSP70/actin superfamily) [Parvibacter caecicola]MCR2042055.1 acyl-CoA dehydratase activase-related protein [Parvibacter caecicola]RNL11441.1 hypothetical protein DMP11_03490 [Parvibacter caecicola]